MSHTTTVTKAESEDCHQFVENKTDSRNNEPEKANWRVEAIKDKEKNVIEMGEVKHFKEAIYSDEG